MHWRMESKTHYINLDAKDIKAYIPQANETIHKHVTIKKYSLVTTYITDFYLILG